jgi:hypothetical protein
VAETENICIGPPVCGSSSAFASAEPMPFYGPSYIIIQPGDRDDRRRHDRGRGRDHDRDRR